MPRPSQVIEAALGFQLLATVTSAPGSDAGGGGGAYGSSQMVKVGSSHLVESALCTTLCTSYTNLGPSALGLGIRMDGQLLDFDLLVLIY